MISTDNINVVSIKPLPSPNDIKKVYPITQNTYRSINEYRNNICGIINKTDNRLLVIMGPCSIHDEDVVRDYSNRLLRIRDDYPNLFIVMRVYFEKPRTIAGWKGLIMDPDLDGSCDITKGLCLARKIMVELVNKGIPIACEFLDTISAQYISDLVSYGAIGARTTQSQLHRQMSSGLSVPIGFKNTTDGNIIIPLNSILSSKVSHTFLGVNIHGQASIVETKGNTSCHLILRGGDSPNYFKACIRDATKKSLERHIHSGIVVDCSHANSCKNYLNQKNVVGDICRQLQDDACNIVGVMIESNIYEGKQPLVTKEELQYGISITDSCVGFPESIVLLTTLNNAIS